MTKPHGIRKQGLHKKFYIKVECNECGEEEVLGCYEDRLDKRKFRLEFMECPNCFKITCIDCENPKGKICKDCGDIELIELTPTEIHRCNQCFNNERKMMCLPCKYPHVKKK